MVSLMDDHFGDYRAQIVTPQAGDRLPVRDGDTRAPTLEERRLIEAYVAGVRATGDTDDPPSCDHEVPGVGTVVFLRPLFG